MKVLPFVPDKVLAINKKYIFGYKKGCLIVRDVNNKKEIKRIRIHSVYKSFHLIERLMRYEPRAAVPLTDTLFMYSDHGNIFKYSVEANSISVIHSFSRGMNNPLTFCFRKDGDGAVKDVLYGEYIWNENKGPVSIYRYDLKKWRVVYSFPAGVITHIHNLIYDKYKRRFLIVTGDEDIESAIWEADEDFLIVKKIVGGSQKFRACVALPTNKGIYYATDTPLEENWLYFLDDEKVLHNIYKMPGPCIYGTIFKECLYMATSVEGNPSLGGWKYRLSNKLGRGVRDKFVHIIKCDKIGNVSDMASFKKDILPMWIFQFGNAQFPVSNDGIYISLQSTVKKGTYKLMEE